MQNNFTPTSQHDAIHLHVCGAPTSSKENAPPNPSQQGLMKPPCYLVSEADETPREKKSYVQGSVLLHFKCPKLIIISHIQCSTSCDY